MSGAPQLVELPWALERAAPPFGGDEDKYPESLPRHFISEFTRKGDRVFDPFMGLGTTAFIAEDMGRSPYGMEHNRQRYEWVAGQLAGWQQIRCGDAATLGRQGFPRMDFAITSPPYMPRHHRWNPLFGGDPKHGGYERYLARMAVIFKALAGIMKRGAYVVIQADNLYHGARFTPLVRDLGAAAERSMTGTGEVIVAWKNAKAGYPYTHCLVFKNTGK